MCRPLVCLYTGCGDKEPYGPGGIARCDPVFLNSGKCKGLEDEKVTKYIGDCDRCWRKKIRESDVRIEKGKARLAELSKELGNDYLEELRAIMRAKGYDY